MHLSLSLPLRINHRISVTESQSRSQLTKSEIFCTQCVTLTFSKIKGKNKCTCNHMWITVRLGDGENIFSLFKYYFMYQNYHIFVGKTKTIVTFSFCSSVNVKFCNSFWSPAFELRHPHSMNSLWLRNSHCGCLWHRKSTFQWHKTEV